MGTNRPMPSAYLAKASALEAKASKKAAQAAAGGDAGGDAGDDTGVYGAGGGEATTDEKLTKALEKRDEALAQLRQQVSSGYLP